MRFGLFAVWKQDNPQQALFCPEILHQSHLDFLIRMLGMVECTVEKDRLVQFSTFVQGFRGNLFAWQVVGWLAQMAPLVQGYQVKFSLVVVPDHALQREQLRRSRLYQWYGEEDQGVKVIGLESSCLFALAPQIFSSPGNLEIVQQELLNRLYLEQSGRETPPVQWCTSTPIFTSFTLPAWLTPDLPQHFLVNDNFIDQCCPPRVQQVLLPRPDGTALYILLRQAAVWEVIPLFDQWCYLPAHEVLRQMSLRTDIEACTFREALPSQPLKEPVVLDLKAKSSEVQYRFSHPVPEWWLRYLKELWQRLNCHQGRILVQLAPERWWFDFVPGRQEATLLVPIAYWPREFRRLEQIPAHYPPQDMFAAYILAAVPFLLSQQEYY